MVLRPERPTGGRDLVCSPRRRVAAEGGMVGGEGSREGERGREGSGGIGNQLEETEDSRNRKLFFNIKLNNWLQPSGISASFSRFFTHGGGEISLFCYRYMVMSTDGLCDSSFLLKQFASKHFIKYPIYKKNDSQRDRESKSINF